MVVVIRVGLIFVSWKGVVHLAVGLIVVRSVVVAMFWGEVHGQMFPIWMSFVPVIVIDEHTGGNFVPRTTSWVTVFACPGHILLQ